MTNENADFELLLNDIQRDKSLRIKDRNNEFACSTLEYFNKCHKGAADHELWRECYMHDEMLNILTQRYYSLNPHLPRLAKFRSTTDPQAVIEYEQEVDEDGLSDAECDTRQNTRYPNLNQKSLELLAAENYIFNKWGIRAAHSALDEEAKAPSQKEIFINTNPILSWGNWVKELEPLSITTDCLNKAVKRCVQQNFGKTDLPWKLRGCGDGYLIVGLGEFKDNKNHPTPAVCKYQKI
jgi:hypothetical protein